MGGGIWVAAGDEGNVLLRTRTRKKQGRWFTHECLTIDVVGSIRSGRVFEVLCKLISVHGSPKHLRSDYGPEFVCRAILKWLTQANIDTAHIDPGKPWQNGCDESFKDAGKLGSAGSQRDASEQLEASGAERY
jgi:transposase InsO family protein